MSRACHKNSTPWKSFVDHASGRTYYHNSATQVTTWEHPYHQSAAEKPQRAQPVITAKDAVEKKKNAKPLSFAQVRASRYHSHAACGATYTPF
jgi:hypothetical protein